MNFLWAKGFVGKSPSYTSTYVELQSLSLELLYRKTSSILCFAGSFINHVQSVSDVEAELERLKLPVGVDKVPVFRQPR